jgi:hypothetical protein
MQRMPLTVEFPTPPVIPDSSSGKLVVEVDENPLYLVFGSR